MTNNLQKLNKEVSKCCGAKIILGGTDTQDWRECLRCGNPCQNIPKEEKECEGLNCKQHYGEEHFPSSQKELHPEPVEEDNELLNCLNYCRLQNGRDDCKNCGLDKAMIDRALASQRQALLKEVMVCLPEIGIKWMQEGNHPKDKKGYTEGFNSCLSIIKSNLEGLKK